MAMEIATNAKWYHMVTLKILVSRISYMIMVAATRNRPAYVYRVATGEPGISSLVTSRAE
jgi:hypothetical protein